MFPPVLYRVIYGSTNPEPWQRALTALRPAMLRGFQRHRVRFADYPAVSPSDSPGACVRGTLVTGLTDGDIFRLDRFEGDEYERRVVKVNVLKGKVGPTGRAVGGDGDEVVEEVEAEAYVWCVEMKGLEVREWDFEEFAKEKAWRWVGKEGVVEYAGAEYFLFSYTGHGVVNTNVSCQTRMQRPKSWREVQPTLQVEEARTERSLKHLQNKMRKRAEKRRRWAEKEA